MLQETTFFNIAQFVGFIAMGIDIVASTQKSDTKLKRLHALASFIFCLHYTLLSGLSGAVSEFLNGTRTLISSYKQSKRIGVGFCLVYFTLLITIPQHIYDVLPLLAGMIITVGVYFCDKAALRLCYLFAWILWLIYSYIIFSIAGLTLFSILIVTTSYALFKQSFSQKE